jgi:hypothetical protein
MMQAVSTNFLNALLGSHQPIARVDAWRDGQLLSPDPGLPISDGSVTITAGQAIRTALAATVADPDGVWIPQADGALSPYGSELHVSLGVQAGTLVELVSMCWSPITVSTTSERWQTYHKPTGGMALVSRGQATQVTGTDRAQIIAAARFMARTQPVAATVLVEIGQLLQGVVPWHAPAGLADVAIPSGITYDDDRLKAVGDLAAVLNCDVILDSSGTATLITRGETDTGGQGGAAGQSVWTIPVRGGAVVTFDRELNADATYNGVIVRGTAFNGATLVGQAVITEGPLAWNGPFGQVPYFVTSATYGTQAQVDSAAKDELARLIVQRSQIVVISCVSNPALEIGDTVTIPAPHGNVDGVIVAAQWPLTPAPMQLSVSVNADELEGVS